MDIEFDKMTVDTSLAQIYLKEENFMLDLYNSYSTLEKQYSDFVFDGKQFIKDRKPAKCALEGIQRKLRDLAKSLKANANLITQLEYVVRNIPIADTDAQLNLIINHLMFWKPMESHEEYEQNTEINLEILPTDVLLQLGGVLSYIRYYNSVLFTTTSSTAVVSSVFVKLCHEVGLDAIYVQFQTDRIAEPRSRSEENSLDTGTVAVVSEDADIDSAVDAFITSSEKAPWRLRRILVQENVYNEFTDALRWKCNLKKQNNYAIKVIVLCSETMIYNNKIFVIDPVNLSECNPTEAITVEAYRTRKEMISLLMKQYTRYVSLWSNNIAEINEITHSVKRPIVWVNNLADFRGPPQIAKAVYSDTFVEEINISKVKCKEISKLHELSQSWLKLDIERRRDILYDVLDKCIISDSKHKNTYTTIRNSLCDFTLESIIDVGKDYVCVVISEPVGIIGISTEWHFFTIENVKSMLCGNAFAVYKGLSFEPEATLEIFEKAGVPVVFVGQLACAEEQEALTVPTWRNGDRRIRAIWTNSGTIFAN